MLLTIDLCRVIVNTSWLKIELDHIDRIQGKVARLTMLVEVDPAFFDQELAKTGQNILRRCVHRGFCNSHCPTFLATKEVDNSPRGRIYLIKQYLQGEELTEEQKHAIQQCVNCRRCETDCPSGVEVAKLIRLAKSALDQQSIPPLRQRAIEFGLSRLSPRNEPNHLVLKLGEKLTLLPSVPPFKGPFQHPKPIQRHVIEPKRNLGSVLLIAGCGDKSLNSQGGSAATSLLQSLGFDVIPARRSGCCGAINIGLGKTEQAKQQMRNNLRTWQPHLTDENLQGVVALSSSCELALSQYRDLAGDESDLYELADKLSNKLVNLAELVGGLLPQVNQRVSEPLKVAVHLPCSLQNGLDKHKPLIELINKLPLDRVEVNEARVCCGSGGSYQFFHPEMSKTLGQRKADNLTINSPDLIITANTSCQMHLARYVDIPVVHWVELVQRLVGCRGESRDRALPCERRGIKALTKLLATRSEA
ncbi:heterodisulfide reductase-related iron-sulfur binding cluster [Vibrio sp. WXL103]|uniref:heterodisulfide reductase-related iron-sulfur binding cluster n=1 Tax=Vibrio sp. WXL103 TaxID=3450710 RepID=UPI003EC6252B